MSKRARILIEESQGEGVRPWARLPKPVMVLVSYNTDVVHKMNARRAKELVCPAKYALFLQVNADDDALAGQILLTHFEEYGSKAVWFNVFSDLPSAIEELRNRYAEIEVAEDISHVIDWPLNYQELGRPGASIVRHLLCEQAQAVA